MYLTNFQEVSPDSSLRLVQAAELRLSDDDGTLASKELANVVRTMDNVSHVKVLAEASPRGICVVFAQPYSLDQIDAWFDRVRELLPPSQPDSRYTTVKGGASVAWTGVNESSSRTFRSSW